MAWLSVRGSCGKELICCQGCFKARSGKWQCGTVSNPVAADRWFNIKEEALRTQSSRPCCKPTKPHQKVVSNPAGGVRCCHFEPCAWEYSIRLHFRSRSLASSQLRNPKPRSVTIKRRGSKYFWVIWLVKVPGVQRPARGLAPVYLSRPQSANIVTSPLPPQPCKRTKSYLPCSALKQPQQPY